MIDSHVHVWTLDAKTYPWQPTLPGVQVPTWSATVEDLIVKMDQAGVDHAVLIQPSTYGWDNSYLCDAIDRYPDRFAGICLVDPHSEQAESDLRHWCTVRGCQGVRVNLIAQTEASWILNRVPQRIFSAALDLKVPVLFQIFPHQADTLCELARRYPDLSIVVDNLGPQMFQDVNSKAAINLLAEHPNIWFKLICAAPDSQQDYPYQDLWPLFHAAREMFGYARILFGTDFPYVLKTCSYQEAIAWPAELPFIEVHGFVDTVDANARSLWSFSPRAN